jgi:hypothetical protein
MDAVDAWRFCGVQNKVLSRDLCFDLGRIAQGLDVTDAFKRRITCVYIPGKVNFDPAADVVH